MQVLPLEAYTKKILYLPLTPKWATSLVERGGTLQFGMSALENNIL